MDYPIQVERIYANPGGNLAASGYYRSSMTQEIANMMPPWMHMRDNPRSIGQQFISPAAMEIKRLETTLNDLMRSKFITTARLDEIDVLYRAKMPSNLDLTDATASGVRCIAAPSGCSPSGVSQIWVKEMDNLQEFYYDVLPTNLEVHASGDFVSSFDDIYWRSKPSGIKDLEENQVDVWGTKHDITWCYLDNTFRKQDADTMEDYEVYSSYPVNGIITDMDFSRGILWCIEVDGSNYYCNLFSAKTQIPNKTTLDILARFDLTLAFDIQPSGIIVDKEGYLRICDTNKTRVFEVIPRYHYFIADEDNRYIYFREDYRNSGVFISNT